MNRKPTLHGHRGARGRRPENTLAAIEYALRCGMDGIEVDLCVTADDQVVLHHDLRLNDAISRDANGEWIAPTSSIAIRELTLRELREYDVGRLRPGSDYAARFPSQRAADGARIPTLRECAELVARFGACDVMFNLELKRDAAAPELTPQVERYIEIVQREVEQLELAPRVLVQSFDWELMRVAAQQRTAWRVGFTQHAPCTRADLEAAKASGGAVFSVEHTALDAPLLRAAHELGLAVCAWTVNDSRDIEAMIELGVDVITTDYPRRARRVMDQLRSG